jgi:hypothetical protein
MDSMEQPSSDAMLDRSLPDADGPELCPTDDPVLALRDRGDPRIQLPGGMYLMPVGNRIPHGTDSAAASVTRVRAVLRGGG